MTMRIFSKFISLSLAAVLLLGALDGCGQTQAAVEAPEIHGDLTMVFPKLGSADACLLMTEDATVLIDTGEKNDGDDLVELLGQFGRNTVDLLMISHYDKDHVGGAAEVIESVSVKRVIGSTSPKESEEMTAYQAALEQAGLTEEAPKNESIVLGGMLLTVDVPKKGSYHTDQSNNSSTIVTVTYGDTVMLFTGDAMSDRIAEFTWQDGLYDLIKIPHHGRDEADLDSYLSSVKPGGAAIITSSKKEPESSELVARLRDSDIMVYRTLDGPVTVISDGSTLHIQQG